MRGKSRKIMTITFLVAVMSVTALPAWAHPHQIDTNHDGVITDADVKLANGQNHDPYVGRQSCGGDPAAYGLETAHHGPDAGRRGKSDGCYLTDAGGPKVDVANPVIR